MERSLYARANFSGLWLLIILSVTRVCSMEVRKASRGSKNSKSLSGSGKRSFQLSTMLSSVLNKKANSLHARTVIDYGEKVDFHGVFVLFKTYTVLTSTNGHHSTNAFFGLGETFTLQSLSRPPRDNDNSR